MPSNNPNAFDPSLVDNITDPTDFPPPSASPGLRDLDSALRCPICNEYFDAPVSVLCGHSFCSMCIRQSLQNAESCPKCRKITTTTHMRIDQSLALSVEAWKTARIYVLELIKARAQVEADRRSASSPITVQQPPQKKRKLLKGNDSPPSSSPSKKKKLGKELSPEESNVVDCPLCREEVSADCINQHIDDGCKSGLASKSGADGSKGKTATANAWSSIFNGNGTDGSKGKARLKDDEPVREDAEKIAIVSYDMFPTKKLRNLLKECDLPTDGDKTVLAERHRQWVNLWNANLDHLLPLRKSRAALRTELRTWEENRNKKGKGIEVKDIQAHMVKHAPHFKDLMAQARASNGTVTTSAQAASSSSGPTASEPPTSTSGDPAAPLPPTTPKPESEDSGSSSMAVSSPSLSPSRRWPRHTRQSPSKRPRGVEGAKGKEAPPSRTSSTQSVIIISD